VEIGYGVWPEFRGRGYATQAVSTLIEWAMAHEDVRRITAECGRDNVASIRVLERAGMRRIAELRRPGGRVLRWELRPTC
jgi:ribosomal-protein-alanine N-acetyltransferase